MNISKTWVWYINHYKACVPATKIIAYNWKYSQSLWMLYILWIFFSSIHHCQKIGCIINNVLSLVNGYFYWWQLFAPLILYLQSSKATLEDIVIVKTWKNKEHVQQQNCCHDASIHCRVTTIYIGKWMINIIHYNSKLHIHDISWIFMRWVMTYCTTDTTFYTIKNCTKRTCLHHINQYNFTTNFQQPIPWYYAIH